MYFAPVSINRLAKEIYKNRNKKGIINVFSSRKISKYNFALNVSNTFGTNPANIKAVKYKNRSDLARRPLDSYIKSDINIPLRDDLEGFRSYIKDVK